MRLSTEHLQLLSNVALDYTTSPKHALEYINSGLQINHVARSNLAFSHREPRQFLHTRHDCHLKSYLKSYSYHQHDENPTLCAKEWLARRQSALASGGTSEWLQTENRRPSHGYQRDYAFGISELDTGRLCG